PVDVVLDCEQEAVVGGELGEHDLRLAVEVVVVLELTKERLEPSVLAQVRHPQKEIPRVLVLRDRLEGLDVLQPEAVHTDATPRPPRWLRAYEPLQRLGQLRELGLRVDGDVEPTRADLRLEPRQDSHRVLDPRGESRVDRRRAPFARPRTFEPSGALG